MKRKRMECGLLKKAEAREWAHWWNIRGHLATLESINWRGYVRCYLTLYPKLSGN